MDLFFIAEVSLNNSFEASLSAPSDVAEFLRKSSSALTVRLRPTPNDLARIAFNCRMLVVRRQSTRKAQMKTILMLIVGLMLAGCESTGNHVRNRDAMDRNRYLVEHNAVDTICACP